MTVLRTRTDGCWEVKTNSWGSFLQPTPDPDATAVITKEQFEGFELLPNTPRIPAALWSRWVNLCIEMMRRGTGDLEVSCRLLRNIEDPSIYRIVVPQQKVTGVSVRVDSFDKSVDIETGEVITQWPPEGWRPCGSSHSHNGMAAFFSGTDDKYELGDPGLHIVVGTIDPNDGTYTLKASVTANKRRFDVDPDDVVDLSTSDTTYHASVVDVIQLPPTIGRTPGRFNATAALQDWTASIPIPEAKSFGALDPEVSAVRDAVQMLLIHSDARGLDPSKALMELCMEIEEHAMENTPVLDDPFYWSSY